MTTQVSSEQPIVPSAFSPLRHPVFRALWIASVVSNIGTWMQAVGAAWLMTTLAPSPIMVSLVQAATTFPMFVLALPSGALADIIDRRRLLLFAQTWMLSVAAVLGVLTLWGITTAWILVALTFALGIGAALNAPAWQAIVLDVVPRSDLSAAVSLNSAGFNVARALGPTLGGLIVAAAGPGVVFLLNAVSFFGVVVVIFRWRRAKGKSVLPTERVFGAMRTGLRYVRYAPSLQTVLFRAAAFVIFASSIRALLPLIARVELGRGPTTYGILLSCLGAGSVAGAIMLPRLRQRLSVNGLVAAAAILFSLTVFTFAHVRVLSVLYVVIFLGGVAWLTLLSTFNASAQASVPLWVRGRALSVYLLIFFGGLAGGSALWGFVAELSNISLSLTIASIGIITGLLLTMRFSLSANEKLDMEPSMDWPTPRLVGDLQTDQGAVMVMVEYRIDEAKAEDFISAMQDLRMIRRRDGSIRWGLGRDTADPARYVEFYVVESWVEHLRQHGRVTIADRAVFERARSFHIGKEPPVVTHFVFATEKKARNEK